MMEKGSFHPSPSDLTDELVKQIPLPNQMPKGIDFKELPATSLKSSTVETLINQNEDLMARLSVSLRKSNQLEERSAVLAQENSSFRAKFEALREQFLILQEKDRISSASSQSLREESGSLRTKFSRLEKAYSELYVQANAFQRRLVHLERYRARVRKVTPAIQERAKRALGLEEDFAQTKKALSASTSQMINSYEAKLADVRSQIDLMRTKAAERDRIFEEKVKLENQLVHDQRQHLILREDTDRELNRLQQENGELRLESKENVLTLESRKVQLTELNEKLEIQEEETTALREQVESLQALWSHKQKEWEHAEQKNRSLQKLNQSLSMTLNQQRKDHHALQTELDRERFSAQEKIKTLLAEVQMLRRQLMEEER